MYKLLFADDEAPVRRKIVQMVPWSELGFTLLGCCSNGHELLEMVEMEPPDLVITDINMPFISGIEAARQIHEDYPGIQIVFLTGHNDFFYAQQAIEAQALKYILKPITPQKLFRELTEIKEKMDSVRERIRILPKMEKLQEKHKELVNSLFFHQLLLSGMEQQEARRRLLDLGFGGLVGTGYCVAVLRHEPQRLQPDEGTMSEDLDRLALLTFAQEHMRRKNVGDAVLLEKYIVLIFAAKGAPPTDLQAMAERCAKEMLSVTAHPLRSALTIGVGRMYPKLSDAVHSYGEAVSALGYRKSLGGQKQILRFEDVQPRRAPEASTGDQVLRLTEAVSQAKQYVDQNYSRPELNANTVSEYLHLSPSYFRALFKKEVGLPFGSYLIKLRMDKAKKLLETTNRKVYEITEAIGFTNPHYFSYCFKQYYNMTPNEMRETGKKDPDS